MITSPELEKQLEEKFGLESKAAIVAFCQRMAKLLKQELAKINIQTQAISKTYAVSQDGFNKTLSIQGKRTYKEITWEVGETLASMGDTGADALVFTVMTDAEIAQLVARAATFLQKNGSNVAFCDLYCPRAVEVAECYNDQEVAFRVVRAYDPVRSCYVMRFDFLYKVLSTQPQD